MKFRASWTWPWGPYFVIITVIALILIQGWSSIFPIFSPVEFVSFYIEIPIMVVMGLCWVLARNTFVDSTPVPARHEWRSDIVDIQTIDLYSDEYDEPLDEVNDEIRGKRFRLFLELV
jgi:amino acid permease